MDGLHHLLKHIYSNHRNTLIPIMLITGMTTDYIGQTILKRCVLGYRYPPLMCLLVDPRCINVPRRTALGRVCHVEDIVQ